VVYKLIRPLLFALDPETAHALTLGLLAAAYRVPGVAALNRMLNAGRTPALPVECMGLRFPNPVGLAAGLDKQARVAAALADFGFGFVELGTVTPRPQPGNPRPRLFRLRYDAALINRMGFNSPGLDVFLANLARQPRRVPIGVNIGKNRDTAAEAALDDYRRALRAVYALADYVAVNVSSPNTPGLRGLQERGPLAALLDALKREQGALAAEHGRYTPLALKIAPDLDDAALADIARLVVDHGFDAVIATNTTVTRPGLVPVPAAGESGGLSGRPLHTLSLHVIARLRAELHGRVPIIGVGGIASAEDAWEALAAGADLVQVYTALIYDGPAVVRKIVTGLTEKVRRRGAAGLREALAGARAGMPAPDPQPVGME